MSGLDREQVAHQIVELIPGVMRQIGAGIHFSGIRMASAHFRLLSMLARHPCNLSELAGKQKVTMATMSNSIETLVERGWVSRSQSSKDRRMIQVELTAEGNQVLVEFHNQLNKRFAYVLKDMTEEELLQVHEGLKLLIPVLNKPGGDTNREINERPCEDVSSVR
jgi:DNA-binding MarR family transcriptional regulator